MTAKGQNREALGSFSRFVVLSTGAMEPPAAVAEKKPEDTKKEDVAAGNKACSACKNSFNKDGYSKAQWAKAADVRKCKVCVEASEAAGGAPQKPAAAAEASAPAGSSSTPAAAASSGEFQFIQSSRLLGNWKKGSVVCFSSVISLLKSTIMVRHFPSLRYLCASSFQMASIHMESFKTMSMSRSFSLL